MRGVRAGVLVLAVAAMPWGGAGAQDGGGTVSMNHFAFAPEELTVPVGTTVTWTYDADAADPQPNCESPQFRANDSCPGHSTTSADEGPDGEPLWDSGVHRAEGFPFSQRFDRPGRYEYFCVVHGGENPNNPVTAMNGVIVVTEAEPGGTGAGGGGSAPPSDPPDDVGAAPDTAAAPGGGATGGYAGGVVPVTGAPGGLALLGLAGLALAGRLRLRR